MTPKSVVAFLLLCLAGFAGGFTADRSLGPRIAMVAQSNGSEETQFYDTQGRRRLDVGLYNNHPLQDFFGADGRMPRLQFGTYSTQVRADEEGLPFSALYDRHGRTRMVLRLDGPNQGPLIIMKDKNEQNRLILGLDIWDGEEAPFLVTWDRQLHQKDILGHFVMKPL
jgi:hypothetical protein